MSRFSDDGASTTTAAPSLQELLANAPNQFFDDLVHLATASCQVPLALVALVEQDQLEFKAQCGPSSVPRAAAVAFCRSVLQANDLITTTLPNLPLGAGTPLRSADGQLLGALCIFSAQRQPLSPAQADALTRLSRVALDGVGQRQAQNELAARYQQLEAALRLTNLAVPDQRPELFVKQDTRLLRVFPADVTYFEALGDYVNLHTVRERLTVYGTMKDMQARLPAADFARVHRKYIIRLDRLIALDGDTVLLDASREDAPARAPMAVPIGNSYKASLLARLQVL